MRAIFRSAISAVLAACLTGCAGGPSLVSINRDQEIQIGRQAAAQLEAQYGVVDEPAATAHLSDIGHRLAAASEEPALPWSFKILNSSEINAVTLPGGFIYVYKGMTSFVQNDDQLAGVVGHEITHAAHHHAKKEIQKAMTQSLLLELITRNSSAALRQASSIALELALRGGYRENEYEADRYGTIYDYRTGFGATGLRDVLQRMYQRGGDPSHFTWLLQSHPPLSKRIERLNADVIPEVTGQRPAR